MLFTDIPVAVGFAVFTCIVTVLASLIADLLYAFADPRIRLY
jgi:peptide/nickel transport system permease protein